MKSSSWIIVLCFLSTLFVSFFPNLVIFLAFTPSDLYRLRLWTLVTALFLHSGILHLMSNMIFLFVLGRTLERVAGAKRFLSVFFIGGILSFVISIPFYNFNTLMLGSSAAIFSVASTVMLMTPLSFSIIFFAPVGAVSLFYFLLNIVSAYYGISTDVAYVSHIIGFMVGVPFGIRWSNNWRRNLGIAILLVIIYLLVIWIISRLVVTF